jgi:hypothetical protein
MSSETISVRFAWSAAAPAKRFIAKQIRPSLLIADSPLSIDVHRRVFAARRKKSIRQCPISLPLFVIAKEGKQI